MMGQFVANVGTAIVPLVAYTGYKMWKATQKK